MRKWIVRIVVIAVLAGGGWQGYKWYQSMPQRLDSIATTKVQRGMHSRYAARGRYSWEEASHVQFNRWLVDRYRRHWPRS